MKLKIFTDKELYAYLVDYNEEDPFEKLDNLDKNIKYFNRITPHYTTDAEHIFFCAMDGDIFIGAAGLKIKGDYDFSNPTIKEWIIFISVHPEYQNQGIAKTLIEELFKYLNENGYKQIVSSGYTQLGLNYLRPKLIQEAKKYDIELLDKNEVSF